MKEKKLLEQYTHYKKLLESAKKSGKVPPEKIAELEAVLEEIEEKLDGSNIVVNYHTSPLIVLGKFLGKLVKDDMPTSEFDDAGSDARETKPKDKND